MQQPTLIQSTIIALALLLTTANAFLVMGIPGTYTRQDPIVFPTSPKAGHIHTVIGSSRFGINATLETLRSDSACTTVDNLGDKSAYWQPLIYSHLDNGTFVPLPVFEARIYYLCNFGPDVTAPPSGLRILAGDSSAHDAQGNVTKGSQYAVFQCQMGSEHNATNELLQRGFNKTLKCAHFLRASVQFPDCWNGRDLDSPDHISHMAYSKGQSCPPDYPVRIPAIVLEWGYVSRDYDPASLVLSNGDTTGYTLHADYINAWDSELLERAVTDPTCKNRENDFLSGPQCNALRDTHNLDAALACKFTEKVPDESVGLLTSISKLPGCNPLNQANAARCPPDQEEMVTGEFVDPIYVSYGVAPNLAIAPP